MKFIPKLLLFFVIGSFLFAAVGKEMVFPSQKLSAASNALENQAALDSPQVTLPFPIKDNQGGFNPDPKNPFDLNDPSVIDKNIVYDPVTNQYIITESIGDRFFRDPTYLSFEDFLNQEYSRQNQEYWKQRSEGVDLLGRNTGYQLNTESETFDRLFGGSNVEIRPKGNIELIFGGSFQNVQNPTLPERSRKNGGFEFDMNINMSVLGKIGDKLKLTTNYNTQATFDFENQVKIEYTGYEDEIIQSIQAGNVSFPLPTTLINGSQSLFGIKSELKFGRLTWSNLLSQQKSKRENVRIEGGAQTRDFEIQVDEYDDNRHFFLGHYFRNNYNQWLSTLPLISSPVVVNKIEVWVTNSSGITENTRDIVGFMDLAESDNIYLNTIVPSGQAPNVPRNAANNLYSLLLTSSGTRDLDDVESRLKTAPFSMQPIRDYEKTRARKLTPQEYTLFPQLGFVSLNQALKPDEVLAVAYEYTYQGQTYRVGEFTQDIPIEPTNPNVLFLKMLKSTSERPQLPIWDLMMKNIYALGAYQVSPEDFRLDVYYRDPGGGKKRYLPTGPPAIKGKPILQLVRLDQLNTQRDQHPDGIFDFINGVTINPNNGRVIFPVVEPFGSFLRQQFNGDPAANQYVYDYLYDSTKVIAQQFPKFNRYSIEGSYKSSVSTEIYLGAFNIPRGSVTVTAGGQQLVEGRDYTVDYNLGRVKIINDGILNSGVPIDVSYENNALFGFNNKTLIANRLDYWISDNFTIGATHMHLSERPYTQKVNFGDDPISNNIYGADVTYNTEAPGLSRLLDRLPIYSTTETSAISLTAEGAYFDPGHNKAINSSESGGIIYIDDFEGSTSSYDLKFPAIRWQLASTPLGATDEFGNILFPEAEFKDSLPYGYNRAKFVWYSLDPTFFTNTAAVPPYIRDNPSVKTSHYIRPIYEQEIFPKKESQTFQNPQISTFDLAYFPSQRGPYNYEYSSSGLTGISAGLNQDGSLKSPESRWGGVMRSLEVNDFEAANVEFIDFWMMDPFDNLGGTTSPDGYVYINLGNISEDILKDSKKFFENGLPKPGGTANLDTSVWGLIPLTQAITNAFPTDEEVLEAQDVGYDGLSSEQERSFFSEFLNNVQATVTNDAYSRIFQDPSSDDFIDYLAPELRDEQIGILERYLWFDGAEGNTAAGIGQDQFAHGSNLPNTEDQNKDNSLNETEEYFQYRIKLYDGMTPQNSPYISDVISHVAGFPDGTQDTIKWYHFKIPIEEYTERVGSIQDFKSIRFVRLFTHGFDSDVVLRFAKFELTRNQWRRYQFSLLNPGEYIPPDEPGSTFFNVGAVSVEENSSKEPIPYAIPPGVEREEFLGSQAAQTIKQNEQALQLQVCGLQDGDARAIYKSLNFDFRKYERLQMFIHAEQYVGEDGTISSPLNDGDIVAFIRLGADFTENYYEFSIPLKVTPPSAYNPETDAARQAIWPDFNKMNILLDSFILAKKERNALALDPRVPFTLDVGDGKTITIVGNPDLGNVKMAMIGLQNPGDEAFIGPDLCAEVWANELRLVGLNESGGGAGLVRADIKLADLGNITLSGAFHTIGFGQLEQKVNDRFQDNFKQYDLATNLELGKLLPKKLNLRIPMYAGISRSFSRPEYDPYDYDIKLTDKLNALPDTLDRQDYLDQVEDYTSIKSLNFTNVRRERPAEKTNNHLWDIENFNFTYAYTETFRSDPTIAMDQVKLYKGGLGYNYATKPKSIAPFEGFINPGSKWLRIIRDINFNPIPNNFSFRTDINRMYGELVLRDVYGDALIDTSYNKDFDWNRFYDLKWDLTKSLKFDFSAINNAQIDEPFGKIDTEEKKDSIWNSISDFGRTVNYRHNMSLNYTAPLSKIPILDWINARAAYGADYGWFNSVSAEAADTIGYTIQNSQTIRLNGDLNMRTLYNKVGFIKNLSQPPRQAPRPQQGDKKNPQQEGKQEEQQQEQNTAGNAVARNVVGVFTSLKRVSLNYNNNRATTLPGFMPETEILGLGRDFTAPGLEFITGFQPDTSDLNQFAANGWITQVNSLNFQFMQTFSETYDVKANFEPFRDMRIDLNWKMNYANNFTEYFMYNDTFNTYQHLNPLESGSWSISYFALNTLFNGYDENDISENYKTFEQLRDDVSKSLGENNPYSQGPFIINNADTILIDSTYAFGYGPYAQEVLVPAFLAAYTGKDITDIKRDIFKTFPKPNWRFTYNGLGKIKPLNKVFTSFNITHAYNSNLTVGSFISDINYNDPFSYGYPSNRDTLYGNYYFKYNVPQIVLTESFSPLIGIDITFVNNLTALFEYKEARNISLSLIDYQVIEGTSTEFTIGAGYRVKGLTLPFNIGGKRTTLDNDLNFRFDFSLRDDKTANYQVGINDVQPTRGALTYSFSPTVDYVVNNRLNVRLFFDRKVTRPHTSLSYPISTTNAGVAIRFTLAE